MRTQDERSNELEQELHDTAQLYVATYQLQVRANAREVLRHVRELLEQLIGVESFALYLADGEGCAQPVCLKGVDEGQVQLRMQEEPLATAFTQRAPVSVDLQPLPRGTLTKPIAVVPLLLHERVVGAIVIVSLFAHKPGWARVDPQLLSLLSTHAAPAMIASQLLQKQAEPWTALAELAAELR